MKLLRLFAIVAFLSGCSSQSNNSINTVSPVNSAKPTTSVNSSSVLKTIKKTKENIIGKCKPVNYEITASGKYLDSGYICPANNPITAYSINGCTWVKAYTRKDGTQVSAHKRCKYNFKTDIGKTTYSSSSSSYGGPVHVRGYYRKNGTYVRPHTRRRARRY